MDFMKYILDFPGHWSGLNLFNFDASTSVCQLAWLYHMRLGRRSSALYTLQLRRLQVYTRLPFLAPNGWKEQQWSKKKGVCAAVEGGIKVNLLYCSSFQSTGHLKTAKGGTNTEHRSHAIQPSS